MTERTRVDMLVSHTASRDEDLRDWMRRETERFVKAKEDNLAGIRAKLERGTDIIKAGHRVKGLNPEGLEKEIPLSETRRERLEKMEYQLVHGNLNGYISPAQRRYIDLLRERTHGEFPWIKPGRSLPNS